MESRQWRTAQEGRIAAKDQANEIFEDRLLDRIAMKFQGDPIDPVDVDQRHHDEAGPVIDVTRGQHRDALVECGNDRVGVGSGANNCEAEG